jgi:HEXXH motif-containing protein
LRIEAAFAFLQQYCPEYYLWCIALTHEVVPLDTYDEQGLQSQSFAYWPNQIHLKVPLSQLKVIDLLVHESSHMYFNILEISGPLCRENAPHV